MRKVIIINTTNLQKGGALQVAVSFIYECLRYPEYDFSIILGKASKLVVNISEFEKFPNIKFYIVDEHPSNSLISFLKFRNSLKRIEKIINPYCVISVFGPCYWKPKCKHIIGFANGYYLYEDSPFFRYWKKNKSLMYKLKKIIQLKLLKYESNLFWIETKDARLRLIDILNIDPNNIIVATNSASGYFTKPASNYHKLSSKSKIRLLYISSYYPHKNFEIIPKVYELLINKGYEIEFIITISDTDFSRNLLLNKCPGIRNLGFVDPEKCPSLYEQSDIVFIPSLLETFTANYPEAMISKKPIVTSDLPFAKTICGNAALYYKFDSAEDASEKIILLINDKNLVSNLITMGLNRLASFDTPESRFKKILNKIL